MIFDAFVRSYGEKGADILSIKQTDLMADLLPANPYHWSQLKQLPEKLPQFYDIKADDRQLRDSVNEQAGAVLGTDFDALRKNYTLRREWLFD